MGKKIKDRSELSMKELVDLYAKESRKMRNAGIISVVVWGIALIVQIIVVLSKLL